MRGFSDLDSRKIKSPRTATVGTRIERRAFNVCAKKDAKTLPIVSGILKTLRALTKSDGKTMIRATGEHNLDSKSSERSDSTKHSGIRVSDADMHEYFTQKNDRSHSSPQSGQFLDMGLDDIYGTKHASDSGKKASDSGKDTHTSVHQMADQQFDLGKAVQGWAGSVIDAGKHVLEGLGKEAPKPTHPEATEPAEKIVPFNPKTHGTPQAWSVSDFEKWLKKNENNEDIIFYPHDDEKAPDIDPGFRLPMDRKGAPEIDRGFQIPSDRTTRKVIKNDDINAVLAGAPKDSDLAAVLAGSH